MHSNYHAAKMAVSALSLCLQKSETTYLKESLKNYFVLKDSIQNRKAWSLGGRGRLKTGKRREWNLFG